MVRLASGEGATPLKDGTGCAAASGCGLSTGLYRGTPRIVDDGGFTECDDTETVKPVGQHFADLLDSRLVVGQMCWPEENVR